METEEPIRKIIHVDMDAFYASVEQRDNPELRGKPIAVGGGMDRGVVSAASYEARKYGVRSAMAGKIAKQLCPHLIFVKSNFDKYIAVSKKIREIFYEYTDLVEPLSLDEAYLDVTHNKKNLPSATLIAQEIRQRIFEETQLTASAGISVNKFIAKVASDVNKPNGQMLIGPKEVIGFLEQLPIEKFHGIGKVTAQKMKKYGIHTGYDLKQKEQAWLSKYFGKSGLYYYNIVRGIHNSEVKPNRIRKSVGAERTFFEDITKIEEMVAFLEKIGTRIEERMEKSKDGGRTITLKIKYHDFEVHTRSKTIEEYVKKKRDFMPVIKELLYNPKPEKAVRLLGISLSNLNNNEKKPKYIQLTLDF